MTVILFHSAVVLNLHFSIISYALHRQGFKQDGIGNDHLGRQVWKCKPVFAGYICIPLPVVHCLIEVLN
jgi:hypothetical protein